jgi:hypothetical protein
MVKQEKKVEVLGFVNNVVEENKSMKINNIKGYFILIFVFIIAIIYLLLNQN